MRGEPIPQFNTLHMMQRKAQWMVLLNTGTPGHEIQLVRFALAMRDTGSLSRAFLEADVILIRLRVALKDL